MIKWMLSVSCDIYPFRCSVSNDKWFIKKKSGDLVDRIISRTRNNEGRRTRLGMSVATQSGSGRQ